MRRFAGFSIPILATLAAVAAASPAAADLRIYLSSIDSWTLQDYYDETRGIAVDADHNVYVTGDIALQKFTNDGSRIYYRLRGDGFLFRPDGVTVDPDGNVYVVNTYDHGVHKFAGDGTFLTAWHGEEGGDILGSPFGIAAGSPGFLAVRTAGHIDTFDSDGTVLDVWASGGGSDLAVDDRDNVYTAGSSLLYQYDRHGTLHNIFGPSPFPEGHFLPATGMAVDGNGFIYIADDSRNLRIFDSAGNFRGYFVSGGNIHDVTLDDRGYIYVLSGRTVRIYGPLPTLPPPPPPPPVTETLPSVILHLSDPAAENACAHIPASVNDVVTSGDASKDGTPYFVYVLLSSGSDNKGLAGVQLGIDYHGMGNQPAVAMNGWTSCADQDYPTDDWPASGSGNTVTWVAPENCQMGAITAAGYFYLTVYAPATMSIEPHPASGQLKVSTCTAMERFPDQSLGLDQVGWVSMGRGSLGTDTNGCNPALEPCLRGTVPVRSTTWGQIKSMYRN